MTSNRLFGRTIFELMNSLEDGPKNNSFQLRIDNEFYTLLFFSKICQNF